MLFLLVSKQDLVLWTQKLQHLLMTIKVKLTSRPVKSILYGGNCHQGKCCMRKCLCGSCPMFLFWCAKFHIHSNVPSLKS